MLSSHRRMLLGEPRAWRGAERPRSQFSFGTGAASNRAASGATRGLPTQLSADRGSSDQRHTRSQQKDLKGAKLIFLVPLGWSGHLTHASQHVTNFRQPDRTTLRLGMVQNSLRNVLG